MHRSARRVPRGPLLMALLALAGVVVPFLVWHQTWFGRRLNPAEIGRYLGDTQRPRRIQHALSSVADGILNGDPAVRRWYPQVAALAQHPAAPVRTTAAWVMGHDAASELFHQALLRLLGDPEPMVRRNAALALVRFGDAVGREEIVQMLRPYTVRAPESATLLHHSAVGQEVGTGSLLARIQNPQGDRHELRSPIAGRVEQVLASPGAVVPRGAPLIVIGPDPTQVWEALRALYLVGCSQDLPDVERYAQPVPHMPSQVRRQAALTAQAIRMRSAQPPIR